MHNALVRVVRSYWRKRRPSAEALYTISCHYLANSTSIYVCTQRGVQRGTSKLYMCEASRKRKATWKLWKIEKYSPACSEIGKTRRSRATLRDMAGRGGVVVVGLVASVLCRVPGCGCVPGWGCGSPREFCETYIFCFVPWNNAWDGPKSAGIIVSY